MRALAASAAVVVTEESGSVDQWIVEVLRQRGEVSLDVLLCALPSGAWSRLFLAVDRLSRAGKIAIRPPHHGDYVISLPAQNTAG
jgi:hypothetical protein